MCFAWLVAPSRNAVGFCVHPTMTRIHQRTSFTAVVVGVASHAKHTVAFLISPLPSASDMIAPRRRGYSKRARHGDMQEVTASFHYLDAKGNPVAKIDRLEPGANGRAKDFLPYLALPKGGYNTTSGIGNQILPLYALPELRKTARRGGTAFFVEGEGKADRLKAALKTAKISATVTTCAFGASADKHFTPHLAQFAGAARVVVLADSSRRGRESATRRAQLIGTSPI
jgi:hypothetical protein